MRRRKTYQVGVLRRRIGGLARKMARAIGGLSAVPERAPRCRLSPRAVMINYGVGTMPTWASERTQWVNNPYNVGIASNKLLSFRALTRAEVQTLDYTDDHNIARMWLNQGKVVYARTILRGTRGDGIVVVSPVGIDMGHVPSAPLYTRNFPKTHEFRVHVAGGQVIDFVEKKARSNGHVDRDVRNHANGWVFSHDDLSTTRDVLGPIAVRAVAACGLDFAGVDMLATLAEGPAPRRVKKAVVCEVNSAPAWECTKTFFMYRRYFNGVINSRTT